MSRTLLVASAILLAPSALAQEQDHSGHAGHTAPAQTHPPAEDHTGHEGHDQPASSDAHAGHAGMSDHSNMRSAFGDYAMGRDASGTAWRPSAAPHHMVMGQSGDWMLMGHGNIDLVYTSQSGPRGDDLGFVSGMLMGTAQRRFDDGSVLQFRGGLSPDPLMGDRGYPLLLAAGDEFGVHARLHGAQNV